MYDETAKCANCGQVIVHLTLGGGYRGWTHTFIDYESAGEAQYRMCCTPGGRRWADPERPQKRLL